MSKPCGLDQVAPPEDEGSLVLRPSVVDGVDLADTQRHVAMPLDTT